jgi:hypothetical protein
MRPRGRLAQHRLDRDRTALHVTCASPDSSASSRSSSSSSWAPIGVAPTSPTSLAQDSDYQNAVCEAVDTGGGVLASRRPLLLTPRLPGRMLGCSGSWLTAGRRSMSPEKILHGAGVHSLRSPPHGSPKGHAGTSPTHLPTSRPDTYQCGHDFISQDGSTQAVLRMPRGCIAWGLSGGDGANARLAASVDAREMALYVSVAILC